MTPEHKKLFNEHYDLAEQIAKEVLAERGKLNGMDVEDYRQAALMGLWEATAKYEPGRGVFGVFARRFMTRRIYDEIRRCDDVGRSRRADGIRGAVVSLDAAVASNDGDRLTVFRDLIAAPQHADRAPAFAMLRYLLDGLDDRKRIIVFLMEIQELPADLVGDVLDLPEGFVRMLNEQALEFLRTRKTFFGRPHEGDHLREVAEMAPPARKLAQRYEDRTFSSSNVIAPAGSDCGPLFGQRRHELN